jgi:WD40 repeat protein
MDQRTDNEIPPWINPEALADFILQLRAAGYKIGVSQHIAAQELLLALIDRGETLNSPEQLGTLLGPVFCTSPTEQDNFQQHFSGWIKFLRDTKSPVNTTDIPDSVVSTNDKTPVQPTPLRNIGFSNFKNNLIYTTFATALLAIVFGVQRDSILPHSVTKISPTVTVSPTIGVLPTATVSPTIGVLPTATVSSSTGVLPTTTVSSSTGVLPTTTVSPKAEVSANPPPSSIVQLVYICAGLFLPLSLAFFIIWRQWRFRKGSLFLQRLNSLQEPELQKLSIGELEYDLFSPILFSHIAKGLKRRIQKPSQKINMEKTIDSTLRNGGFLIPVYEILQVPLEYLILIDRSSFRDHQAQFIEEMIDRLKQDGVFITKYFFEGNPKVCFGESIGSPPKKLKEIMNQYQHHLLIIASDAHEFFSALNGELEPWVDQLGSWQERAILTPNPIGNWVRKEMVLAQIFLVLPATLQGLRTLSQILNPDVTKPSVLIETHQVPLPEQFTTQPLRWIDREPPDTDLIKEILRLTEYYLGEAGYYWLSACAIFPEIHWIITLCLGDQLKMEDNSSLAAGCSLENLVRLPWFRYGYMPDWLRILLIENLSDQQKSDIRSVLGNILVAAFQDIESQQQLVLATKQSGFRYFNRRVSEPSILRDYLFLCFMKEQPLLAIKVPEKVKSLLNKKALYKSFPQSSLAQLANAENARTEQEKQRAQVKKDLAQSNPLAAEYKSRIIKGITGLFAVAVCSTLGWMVWRHAQLNLADALSASALSLIDKGKELDAFIPAIRAGKILQNQQTSNPSVLNTLQEVLNHRSEYNRLEGHQDSVWSVSFSPDGKTLATGSLDNTIKLWNIDTGKEISTIRGHRRSVVYGVSFSPDGKTLAIGNSDSTIKLWNIDTGKEIRTLQGHQNSVYSVSFSPDGMTLATGSGDRTIKLWNIDTGKEIRTLQGHQNSVYSVRFSPDGMTLATGSGDRTTKLWNIDTGKEIRTLQGHQSSVWSVSFSPDGKTLATGSLDSTIKLWNIDTGKEIRTLQGHQNSVYSISFSPNGKILATGSSDSTIKLWNIDTGKEIRALQWYQDNILSNTVLSISFSPDSKTLATGSSDNTIKLWNIDTSKEIRTLQGHQNSVSSVSFSPNGKTLATGSTDKTIKLWNLDSSKEIRTLRHQNSVSSVSFSPNGKTLATGSLDSTIKLWDLETGNEIRTLQGHQNSVWSVSFSPDGKTFVISNGNDTTENGNDITELWNVDTKTKIRVIDQNFVLSMSFSPDGKTLATGSSGSTIKLWDLDMGNEIHTLQGHQNSVLSVSFSPDGRILASGSNDKTIKLWNIDTGEEIRTLQGHQNSVLSVSFSPDGRILASGSNDKTIKLWNIDTGEEIRTLQGHQNSVLSVSFSPDGKILASGSNDKTIKLWNRESGWDLNALMGRSCDWVRAYLDNNINISESDKHLCDGIGPKNQ